MPTYTFRDTKTKRKHTEMMKISEMEQYLVDHPNKKLVVSAPGIVSGVAGVRRPDDGFRDILKRIKKNNRGSNINIR